MHFVGVIQLVSTAGNAIQLPNVEASRQLILGLVYMCDGDNASTVIELFKPY